MTTPPPAVLAAIRLRDWVRDGEIPHNVHCASDRHALLAEYDRLVAELTRSREALRALILACWIVGDTGIHEHHWPACQLCDEVKRARAALGEEPADGDANA